MVDTLMLLLTYLSLIAVPAGFSFFSVWIGRRILGASKTGFRKSIPIAIGTSLAGIPGIYIANGAFLFGLDWIRELLGQPLGAMYGLFALMITIPIFLVINTLVVAIVLANPPDNSVPSAKPSTPDQSGGW